MNLACVESTPCFQPKQARRSELLSRVQCCAKAGRQRTQNTTKFPINYHTNLPCLSLYRRRQTSLALKAHRAFNPKQARRSELLSRAQCCAKAGRRAARRSPNHKNANTARSKSARYQPTRIIRGTPASTSFRSRFLTPTTSAKLKRTILLTPHSLKSTDSRSACLSILRLIVA